MSSEGVTFERVGVEALPRLEEIRAAAFAPVFASFRSILGDDLYSVAQAHDDAAQPDWGGRGIGTAMYSHALARMREAGMHRKL